MVLFLGMSTTVTAILAAGSTPFLGATGCILWDRSWLGSPFSLHLFKVCFGAVIFSAFCVSIRLPTYDRFTLASTSMLAVCSFFNIAVGDNLWFISMKLIGVRRIIMIDTMKPFLAAIMGAVMLKQPFTLIQLIGISLSSLGLLLVSIDRKPKAKVILGANGDAQGAGVFNDSRVGENFDMLEALKSVHDVGMLSAINADDFSNLDTDVDGPAVGLGGDLDDELDDANDNVGCDYDEDGAGGRGYEASMHLSMSHHPGGGGAGRLGGSSGRSDRSNLPFSTLFLGYFYAIVNVSLDAITAVVVVRFGQQFNPWEVCAIRYVTGAVCLIVVAFGMLGYTCCQGVDFKASSFKNRKQQSYINSSASSQSVRDLMPFQSLGQQEDGPGVQMSPLGAGPGAPEEDVESFERYTSSPNTPGSGSPKRIAASNPLHRREKPNPLDSDSVMSEDILPPRDSNYNHVAAETAGEQNQDEYREPQWFMCPSMPSDNWQMVILGTTFVTFCCPLLYNYSLFKLNVGLCLTLTSLGPIYSIPLVYYVKGETTTYRAFLGLLITVCGVVILCYGQFEAHNHTNEANVVSPGSV
jgi:drug/metabolite transporter (DMT)-like permease